MKKVALFISLFICVTTYSQVAKSSVEIYSTPFKTIITDSITTDSTYWFSVRGDIPANAVVDYTYLSGSTATVDIYKGYLRNDSIYYVTIDGLVSTDLPMTLDLTANLRTSEADTMNVWGVIMDYWLAEYLGVKITTNGETGPVNIIIAR